MYLKQPVMAARSRRTPSPMLAVALLAFLSALACPIHAQGNYPASPVRMLVGFAPGGTTDIIARALGQKLSTQLNAVVLIENKPGASGNVSAETVAKSKPDGYTLLFMSSGIVLSRAFGEKLGYDILKDLAPVSLVASAPYALVATPSMPANNMGEFFAQLKANPDKFNYGSSGNGSISHVGMLMLLKAGNTVALHVPYKGADPMLLDIVAGRLHFGFQSVVAAVPQVKERRVKALAVTSLSRSSMLPDVPTVAETVPKFELGAWFAVLAPAGTPLPITQRLGGEVAKAVRDTAMKSRLQQEGAEPIGSTPEELSAYLKSEVERWGQAAKSAGLKLE